MLISWILQYVIRIFFHFYAPLQQVFVALICRILLLHYLSLLSELNHDSYRRQYTYEDDMLYKFFLSKHSLHSCHRSDIQSSSKKINHATKQKTTHFCKNIYLSKLYFEKRFDGKTSDKVSMIKLHNYLSMPCLHTLDRYYLLALFLSFDQWIQTLI